MRKIFIIVALAVAATVATAQNRHQLTIVVDNVDSAAGRVMVGIYNKERGAFEQESRYDGQAKPAVKGRVTFIFELPEGSYAVGAYHDQNNNGVLDKNWIGIPKEPYAMSGGRKIPDFKASTIKVDSDKTITVKL